MTIWPFSVSVAADIAYSRWRATKVIVACSLPSKLRQRWPPPDGAVHVFRGVERLGHRIVMPLKMNITKRASIICASMPWEEAMATLAELARPYLERFQALLAAAAPEDASMVSFMRSEERRVGKEC